MSGDAAVVQDSDEESSLNWSVSGITNVSGFDPDQNTRENDVMTPDLSCKDEILDRLVDNVRNLKGNLATITEKSLTPVNSPRPSSSGKDGGEDTTIPSTVIKRAEATPASLTPPVKDPGLGTTQLDDMRRRLRELESSKHQNNVARRTLSFGQK